MSVPRTDPLSYTANARLKVLLAPLRPLRRSRFQQLAERVRSITDVRLEDVTVTTAKSPNYFDPRRIPAGRVLLDFVTEIDREHSYLESFEVSRQVFGILLLGDGTEVHNSDNVAVQIKQVRASAQSTILLHTLIFDPANFDPSIWPVATQAINDNNSASAHPGRNLRDALVNFISDLLSRMNDLYIETRERTNITSPYDPASILIRPQPQRMSSFALGDAHITPSASPPPGQDKSVRNSLGPGILASAERLKVISNGRAAKLCGDLLLVTGFCTEAMKAYAEAAAVARANNDYLWQGAALESIGTCIVLCSFLDVSYQIPQIAQAVTGSTASSKRSERRPSSSSNRGEVDLVDFLPELHASTLSLYQKSTTTQSDQVPALVLSESSLRIAKLLATVHMAGSLSRRALDHLVLGVELNRKGQEVAAYPPRAEIAAWAMRAYQGPIQSLSLSDRIYVLSGLASVHGAIGFNRRRALFLREILLALTPALIQARVAGAAGMGIHPSASLALSESPANNFSREILIRTQQTGSSLASLLEDISQSYDIPRAEDEGDIIRVVLGGYGWTGIKDAITKDCMSMCEAIPDFEGLLRFSARALEYNASKMERDEQVRLVANIPRITSIARRSGLQDIEIDYWDNFLVRAVEVRTQLLSLPVKRDTKELGIFEASSSLKNNPFLYNPYERKSLINMKPTMVQMENTEIEITLQNPFLFDIEALEIELLTDRDNLTSTKPSAYIKAGTTTCVSISCKATTPESFRILGCRIKMSGCRPRSFDIRHAPSHAEIEAWHIAHGGLFRAKNSSAASRSNPEASNITLSDVVTVDVLPEVPVLHVKYPTMTDVLTIAVLEGEASTLEFKLENSSHLPINFLVFSLSDSTEKPLLQAINSRAKQPHEIHELETFLYKRKAFLFDHNHNPALVPAHSSETFSLDVRGKRGLVSAQIMVSYGHISASKGEGDRDTQKKAIPSEIYTRQITIPLRCIVQHALDFLHCDILPISVPSLASHVLRETYSKFTELINLIPSEEKDLYQVLILDIRNSQPQPMTLSLSFRNVAERCKSEVDIPGHSQERLIIPLRRAELSRAQLESPIPSLSDRQFIVSSVSREIEQLEREIFWSREDFLSRLEATWRMGTRSGKLETRSITFTKRMVDNYLLPRVQITLSLADARATLMDHGQLLIKIKRDVQDEDERMILRIIVTDPITQAISEHFQIMGSRQIPLTLESGTTVEEVTYFAVSQGTYCIQVSLAPILSQDKIVAISSKLEVEVTT